MQRSIRQGTLAISFLSIVPLALVATQSAHAQRYLGGMNGVIQDRSGAKIAGAGVTAVETSTHFTTKVQSDASGTFTMPALNPGTYNLTIEAPGFATETREGVLLTAGQLQAIEFNLRAGAASEVIEVRAENSLLDNGSPNIATTLSEKKSPTFRTTAATRLCLPRLAWAL